MKRKKLINKNDNNYNFIINEMISKYWETLIILNRRPLSESKLNNELKSLETMILKTAILLPDNARKKFLKELQQPTYLNENVVNMVQNAANSAANAMVNMQNKVDKVKGKISQGMIKTVKYVWHNYIPQSVKSMGAAIAKKIGKILIVIIGKAGKLLKKLSDKLTSYGKNDPCFKKNNPKTQTETQKNEALIRKYVELITESVENLYFVGDKNKFILNKKEYENLSINDQVAKIIVTLKTTGIKVYGKDLRAIVHDVYANLNNNSTEAQKILGDEQNKAPSMAEWFKKNKIKDLIKKYENQANPQVDSETGESLCKQEEGFIEKYFGSDSNMAKAWEKLGFNKDSKLSALVTKLSENKTSLFITLGSIITTFATGGGALRIAGLVFASVIPLVITMKIKFLKEKNALKDQIEFWEKSRSISKFINTIIQIFNIGALIQKGWEALTNMNVNDVNNPDLSNSTSTNTTTFSIHDLKPEVKSNFAQWIRPDSEFKLDRTVVKQFFDNVVPHMSQEQFEKFNEIAGNSANFDEVEKIINQPQDNGILDIIVGSSDNVNTYDILINNGFTEEQAKLISTIFSGDYKKINYIIDIVKNKELTIDEINTMINNGINSGQSAENIFNGIKNTVNNLSSNATDGVPNT